MIDPSEFAELDVSSILEESKKKSQRKAFVSSEKYQKIADGMYRLEVGKTAQKDRESYLKKMQKQADGQYDIIISRGNILSFLFVGKKYS